MIHQIQVTANGKCLNYLAGTRLDMVCRDFQEDYEHRIILARVNGRLRELSYALEADCELSFITTGDPLGMEAYVRSCKMILVKAFYDIVGKERIHRLSFMYSVGDGIYGELDAQEELSSELISKVRKQMKKIVADKLDFIRRTVPMSEALEIFREYGLQDKTELFYYRRSLAVDFYILDDTIDYMYGCMAPDTSYTPYFDLQKYGEGFLLRLPDNRTPETIEPYKAPQKFFRVFKQSKDWSKLLGVRNIADLNRIICDGKFADLVLVQEALMEKYIGDIAARIVETGKRMVLIAGPSSSGKTSFANRLCIQLRAQGLKPHQITVDNYFLNRENTPKDADGNYDYECLEALDVKKLNEDMHELLDGRPVELPYYNFITGERERSGKVMQIGDTDVLVIEGIHSLNDKMSYSFAPENKFKIYISALTQLNIDDHSRIPTTDVRLIRRMCRDAAHRGASAEKTLEMWHSVRRGEDRNIFPYQEQSDYMFNSALIYELAVLKPTVEPLLFRVKPDSPAYDEAKRLLDFMNYILPAGREIIPQNSIIREFIGGSCFDVG